MMSIQKFNLLNKKADPAPITNEMELIKYANQFLLERAGEAEKYKQYSRYLRLLIIIFGSITTVLIQTEVPRIIVAAVSAFVIILTGVAAVFKFEERYQSAVKNFGEIRMEVWKLRGREEPYDVEDDDRRLWLFTQNFNEMVQEYQIDEAIQLSKEKEGQGKSNLTT